jgi:hypothetical protein
MRQHVLGEVLVAVAPLARIEAVDELLDRRLSIPMIAAFDEPAGRLEPVSVAVHPATVFAQQFAVV